MCSILFIRNKVEMKMAVLPYHFPNGIIKISKELYCI